jgi:hypothetical protein
MKKSITILFLLTSIILSGQSNSLNEESKITIKGITTTTEHFEKSRLNKVKIHIYEYNKKIHTYNTDKKGKFEIKIPENSYTVIEFEKENFITKRFLFDTRTSSKSFETKPFKLEVIMLKNIDGIDYSELDFPITRIEYNEKTQDFDFASKYTERMLKKQEKILLKQEKILLETADVSLRTTP